MTIAVWADIKQWEELTVNSAGINWIQMISIKEKIVTADAYFILKDVKNFDFKKAEKPTVIHAVSETLQVLQAPGNVIRINAWPGFLQRNCWEIAGNITVEFMKIMAAIHQQYIVVKDEPGLVAGRTIAMLINEAYFALGEGVSTREEIDIAMQLGTNYPIGLFEWANRIGVQNILSVLQVLNHQDKRYDPAPLLLQEAGI